MTKNTQLSTWANKTDYKQLTEVRLQMAKAEINHQEWYDTEEMQLKSIS